jgi:hypothetical protein
MKVKASVNLAGCSFQIGYAAAVASFFFNREGVDFIVTSAKDGTHGTGSLHAKGDAIDIRTRHLTTAQGDRILRDIKLSLELFGFDVIDERAKPGAPHFHVEFQPKAGESFTEVAT